MRSNGYVPIRAPGSQSLRKNVLWTFLGKCTYAGCQWGVLIILAKFGTPEMVGRYALAVAIAAPLMILARGQTRSLQAADASQRFGVEDYVGFRVVATGVAFVVALMLASAVGYAGEVMMVLAAVLAAKSFDNVGDAYHGLFQQREQMQWIGLSHVMRGCAGLIGFSVTLLLSGSLVLSCWGLATGWALVVMLHDVPMVERVANAGGLGHVRLRPRVDVRRALAIGYCAAPLAVAGMFSSLAPQIPRFAVEANLGEAALGIFAALSYFIFAGLTVVQAVGQAAIPRLAKHSSSGRYDLFRQLTRKVLLLGCAISSLGVAVAYFFGEMILRLAYTTEYAQYSSEFVIIMVAGGVGYVATLGATCNIALQRFKLQMLLYGSALPVIVASCAVLLPVYGMAGAAMALLLGNLVRLGLVLLSLGVSRIPYNTPTVVHAGVPAE